MYEAAIELSSTFVIRACAKLTSCRTYVWWYQRDEGRLNGEEKETERDGDGDERHTRRDVVGGRFKS